MTCNKGQTSLPRTFRCQLWGTQTLAANMGVTAPSSRESHVDPPVTLSVPAPAQPFCCVASATGEGPGSTSVIPYPATTLVASWRKVRGNNGPATLVFLSGSLPALPGSRPLPAVSTHATIPKSKGDKGRCVDRDCLFTFRLSRLE